MSVLCWNNCMTLKHALFTYISPICLSPGVAESEPPPHSPHHHLGVVISIQPLAVTDKTFNNLLLSNVSNKAKAVYSPTIVYPVCHRGHRNTTAVDITATSQSCHCSIPSIRLQQIIKILVLGELMYPVIGNTEQDCLNRS